MKSMNTKKGFTLIELLIVIAIIAILAVAFLPTLLGAPAKGRDTSRLANLNSIQKALIYDNLTNSKAFPSSADATKCAEVVINATDNPGALANMGGKVPKDPSTSRTFTGTANAVSTCAAAGSYYYIAAPSAAYSYGLYAVMENSSNNTVNCTKALTGVIAAETTVGPDLCYAILAQ